MLADLLLGAILKGVLTYDFEISFANVFLSVYNDIFNCTLANLSYCLQGNFILKVGPPSPRD